MIGVEPGSVVVTSEGLDGLLRPVNEVAILGRLVLAPVIFDQNLVQELVRIGKEEFNDFETLSGATLCTADFYEGQARLDGAFCSYSAEDKMKFLDKIHKRGVVNVEMEATTFGSMCYSAGIPAAILCVTLLNRLVGDQIVIPEKDYEDFCHRPQRLAARFIEKRLGKKSGHGFQL